MPDSAEPADHDHAGPVDPDERIVSLDVLRGVALLGILVINIWLFSMPQVVLSYPPAFGDFSGANYWAWFVSHVFAELKFITLFSMLFGAGMLLFFQSKNGSDTPAMQLFVRRNILLVMIGLGHAFLLWYGDILIAYGLCAFFIVAVRDWQPKDLAVLGVVLAALPALLELLTGLGGSTAELNDAILPAQTALDAEVTAYQGGWLEQMDHRIEAAIEQHTVSFLGLVAWRASGMMLLGMALFKWGVLTNDRSATFYRKLIAVAGSSGLALILAGVWHREFVDWEPATVVLFSDQLNYFGSILLSLAYIGIIMLFCRRWATSIVGTALAAVGKTAFSNYLFQTVAATTIFYGHGLGWFGTASRVEQLGIVLAIWLVQILLSVLWLRYFRFGPVEWVWRSLTYGETQQLRR